MSKIWLVDSKYHKRTFKSEKTFLDFISAAKRNRYKVNYSIKIYELVEEHDNSDVYLNSYLTQKERDEQLSVVLENNQEIQILQKINQFIEEYNANVEKPNRSLKKYLDKISLLSLNFSSFKKVISLDSDIRRAFLYHGPTSVEWYQTILSVHNFKFETEIKVGRNKTPVPQERIDNFKEAKSLLRKK